MTGERERRSFLFLQGPLSPLYRMLGERMRAAGHEALMVNFSAGDWLLSRRPHAIGYRGRIADWSARARELIAQRRVTDLVLHGERRLLHRIAAAQARSAGARVICTELGYLRPDWMTIELNGTGAASHFPDAPERIRAAAAAAPPVDFTPLWRTEFSRLALPDMAYNLVNWLLWPLYPHYRRHTVHYPPLEYAAHGLRLALAGMRIAKARDELRRLAAAPGGWFLFALQLEGDFQIRHRSPFPGLAAALDHVFASFAAHAPAGCALALKAHPLDNGLEEWRRRWRGLARRHGLCGRVRLIDGGAIGPMLRTARGLVTVNSSAAIEALQTSRPAIALAPAIYDVAGLTHRSGLDAFWRRPEPPCADLVADFLRALAGAVQARGSIHSANGLEAAVDNIAARILENRLNAPGGFDDPAPRASALRACLRAQAMARRGRRR